MDEPRYCVACGVLLSGPKEHPASAYGLLCKACYERLYPRLRKRNSTLVPVKYCGKCGVLFVAWSDNVIAHAPCPT